MLTLFRIGLFRATHDGESGGGWWLKKGPLFKFCYPYLTLMKIDTVIPYLKKIQKI